MKFSDDLIYIHFLCTWWSGKCQTNGCSKDGAPCLERISYHPFRIWKLDRSEQGRSTSIDMCSELVVLMPRMSLQLQYLLSDRGDVNINSMHKKWHTDPLNHMAKPLCKPSITLQTREHPHHHPRSSALLVWLSHRVLWQCLRQCVNAHHRWSLWTTTNGLQWDACKYKIHQYDLFTTVLLHEIGSPILTPGTLDNYNTLLIRSFRERMWGTRGTIWCSTCKSYWQTRL
jgi:hypothetical protein